MTLYAPEHLDTAIDPRGQETFEVDVPIYPLRAFAAPIGTDDDDFGGDATDRIWLVENNRWVAFANYNCLDGDLIGVDLSEGSWSWGALADAQACIAAHVAFDLASRYNSGDLTLDSDLGA